MAGLKSVVVDKQSAGATSDGNACSSSALGADRNIEYVPWSPYLPGLAVSVKVDDLSLHQRDCVDEIHSHLYNCIFIVLIVLVTLAFAFIFLIIRNNL